jgi:hypothetical protein
VPDGPTVIAGGFRATDLTAFGDQAGYAFVPRVDVGADGEVDQPHQVASEPLRVLVYLVLGGGVVVENSRDIVE